MLNCSWIFQYKLNIFAWIYCSSVIKLRQSDILNIDSQGLKQFTKWIASKPISFLINILNHRLLNRNSLIFCLVKTRFKNTAARLSFSLPRKNRQTNQLRLCSRNWFRSAWRSFQFKNHNIFIGNYLLRCPSFIHPLSCSVEFHYYNHIASQ